MGLLLLGKGAVLAHGFERPLAAEMDDYKQSADTTRANLAGCSFPRMRASPPVRSARPLRDDQRELDAA